MLIITSLLIKRVTVQQMTNLVSFFENEKKENGEKSGIAAKLTGLFSTHPLDAERIAAIRAQIEKIKLKENQEIEEGRGSSCRATDGRF